MTVFDHPEYEGHEEVAFFADAATGLRAIVAVHSTVAGPSGGGLRFYPYVNDADAVTDVLRLSKAMTWKMALAGLPFGGGKSVIVGEPARDKTEALLEAYGRAVDTLGGRYICGEDVGTTPDDMAVIHRATEHVGGRPDTTGDTSPTTGYGLAVAAEAAVRRALGRELDGATVAIQGAGNVGKWMAKYLAEKGAKLVVADLRQDAARALAEQHGGTVVAPGAILAAEADVLAPCAMGGVLDDASIPRIKAKVVCGGANNQLAEPRHARALHERGILFVPDYVANAGGAIGATAHFLGRSKDEVQERLDAIAETVARVIDLAERDGVPAEEAAQALARAAIEEKRAGRAAPEDTAVEAVG